MFHAEAKALVERFLAGPGRVWSICCGRSRSATCVSSLNQVPEAHLVTLMDQHGISTIWTHDRDFRKFDGITVRDPFGGGQSK